MEKSAGNPGKLDVGDRVVSTSTWTLSVSLKNVSTLESWDHQKTDFIRGHSIVQSCITDEMFVVHLLEVHAELCANSLCKCRCFHDVDVDNLMRGGPSGVDNNIEAVPEASRNCGLQRVAMESPDVSHDQQMDVMAVEIKVEEESEDDGGEHVDGDSCFWLNREPSLAIRGIKSYVESKDLGNDGPRTYGKITLTEKSISSSNQVDWTEEQAYQERESAVIGSRTHFGIPTGERHFGCKMCLKNFTSKQDLARHIRTHTCERPFSCNRCEKVFTQKSHLEEHMNWHTDEKPFSCGICPQSFFQKYDLERHMRTHTGERPFSCNICEKSFTQKTHLGIHMRTHTGERPFSCNMCEKAFTRKDRLKDHINMHTGERPFSCKICKRAFSQKGHLKEHMNTHTGEKSFSCKICLKNFTTKQVLARHIRTHTGEKPFGCSICGKVFSQKGNLKDHMNRHTGEKPFSCNICPKAFTRKAHLMEHMLSHTA